MVASALLVAEFAETYLQIPGRIENRVMIYDCKDLGVMSFPYALIKDAIGVMGNQYKQRPVAIFILNAPETFSTVYSVISQVLDASVTAKIKIVSENTSDDLKKLVHES